MVSARRRRLQLALRAATREEIRGRPAGPSPRSGRSPAAAVDFQAWRARPARAAAPRRQPPPAAAPRLPTWRKAICRGSCRRFRCLDCFRIPFAAFSTWPASMTRRHAIATTQQQLEAAEHIGCAFETRPWPSCRPGPEHVEPEPAQIRARQQQAGPGSSAPPACSCAAHPAPRICAALQRRGPLHHGAQRPARPRSAGAVRKVCDRCTNSRPEARRAAGLAESQVVMGVLVQKAVDLRKPRRC